MWNPTMSCSAHDFGTTNGLLAQMSIGGCNIMKSLLRSLERLLWVIVLGGLAAAQQSGPVAQWKFDQSSGANTRDAIAGIDDVVSGYSAFAVGVFGNAIRFDGYTTG